MTAGTILHGSKLALTVWFWAAYLMATHSNGIAALQLQNQLGIGSRSAWLLAAKLRKAMVDPERDPLSGLIAGRRDRAGASAPRMIPWPAAPGACHDGKLLVVGAVEVGDGNAPGRLRLAEIASYGAESDQPLHRPQHRRRQHRQDDGWAGYAAAPVETHDPHVIGSMAAHLVLPWIHQVFSNLKAGARRLSRGCAPSTCKAISYEFVFRFNRRRTRHAAFRSLFGIAVCTKPFTYTCWSGRKLVHKRFLEYSIGVVQSLCRCPR